MFRFIKQIFKTGKMQRTKINPHKNEAAIKEALSRCKTENSMDYDTFKQKEDVGERHICSIELNYINQLKEQGVISIL